MADIKIFFMGECMAELSAAGPGLLRYGFAGDVINTAIYLKRCFPQIHCALLSALGTDPLSAQMLEFLAQEQLDTSHVLKSVTRVPGLYWINTNSQGERSFIYWRENSAARQIMALLNNETLANLKAADWFYFSGISLAVIPPADRPALFSLLVELRTRGVKLAFDSNFRPQLWSSTQEAQHCFAQAMSLSHLLFAGVEDFSLLYPQASLAEIKLNLTAYGLDELILKNGAKDIAVSGLGFKASFPVRPVAQVVDTTSAGDSFNGAYLGARVSGMLIPQAVNLAASCAALVIQHPGAIIDQQFFKAFSEQLARSA